jgi:polysaccharide export outer membrane protein
MTAALLLTLLLQAPATDASTEAERVGDVPAAAPAAPVEPPTEAEEEEPPASSTEEPAVDAVAPDPPASTPAATSEYQVGPGDGLEVTVIGNDDLSRIPTVQTNGAIVLPLLGEVQVAGLTVSEIQRKVTSLLEKDYLVNPQVVVKVTQYNSQFVTLVGEVNQPGRKPLRGRSRLIDMLVEAGGFTPRASGEVVINRADGTFPGGERTLRIRLSGGALTVQDQINLEMPLRNGDIISASPKFFVTVDGEVNRPGRYAIESDLTVTGAISLAGGRTRFGADDVKVRRTEPDSGDVTVIKVDLDDVRNGKKPDVTLKPNDVITVPRRFF